MKNWQSNSFMGNAVHNSAFGEQEYDVDEDDIEVEAKAKVAKENKSDS